MPRKTIERKLSITDAVSEAHGEIEALGEEMREAYDNTPENLQQSAIGEARDQAASDLENISEVEVPEPLAKIELTLVTVQRTPKQQMRLSRGDRRDDAVQTLDAVIQRLDEITDEALHEDVEGLRQELDDMKSNAEAVEFPGRNA